MWGAFAAANIGAMIAWPSWETIPFHFVWISLTLLYGFRVWSPQVTVLILAAVVLTTGGSILADAFAGIQLWGELFEVPLMSAMFLAMVWHARRRVAAIQESEALAESRATLLARQERFLHDVTHELRTPVTIARGHLELLQSEGRSSSEVAVALDELGRIERIITRLLLLAKADRPDFLATSQVDVEAFVEDVFMRWSEVAPRSWRLGSIARGQLTADEEALRIALDSLVENAVKYTEEGESIELRAISGGTRSRSRSPTAAAASPRRARSDLRALRTCRRRTRPRGRGRRPRTVHRRRDRESARRRLHGGVEPRRNGLCAQPPRISTGRTTAN